jgi:acyl carrier protein
MLKKGGVMELFNKITEIISRNIDWQDEIRPEERLKEDLAIDSLDVILIINEIEDEFSINVEQEEVKCLGTVQDIVDKLRQKLDLQAVA